MTGIDGQQQHCDVEWLGRRLQDADAVAADDGRPILVDCRPASLYGVSHIGGAVSLAPPALIQRRLLKGNTTMPVALGYCSPDDRGAKVDDDRWKSNIIVLYGDDDVTSQDVASDDVTNGSATSKFVSVLLKQLKKEGYSVCYLSGGLKQFRAKYPHLCTSSRCEGGEGEEEAEAEARGLLPMGFRNLKLSTTTAAAPEVQPEETMTSSNGRALPVEVLPRLYLGDAKNASDLECLDGKGIRYILNVTPNVPNAFERNEDFRYLQIPIKDHWSQNLTNYFPRAITFIDEGRRLNTGVLVHCLAGISRSVTVTVAYLMYSMSLSLNDAYDYVKQRKPNVSPNLTFMGQLLDFENALKVDRKSCLLCPSHSTASFSSSPPPPPPASSSSSTSSCSSVPPSDSETGSCRQEAVGSDACALPSTTTTTTTAETTTT